MKKIFLTLTLKATLLLCLMNCSEDEILRDAVNDPATKAASISDCGCTYTVPASTYLVDGKILGIKAGSVICLKSTTYYKNILFRNIVGSASSPVIIKNCGGPVVIHATGMTFGLKTESSKYFRITGGDVANTYGISIDGGHVGVTLEKLSTNFTIDHLEISKVGFAGIMAKTDPTCDDATIRGNFTMADVTFRNNYVHDTGGEGFYVGNSFFDTGMKTACGVRYPHEVHNAQIYSNIVKNSGWEGIQVGSATVGAKVFDNRIENYGLENRYGQNNGLQIGVGTGGACYNNFISGGKGNGLIVLGLGDNIVHDNIILNAGAAGIYCDDRYSPGPGFQFLNNTIINPKTDGIKLYAEYKWNNVVINNIIANPGSYSTYTYPRTGNDSYVYLLSKNVKTQISNNYFTRSVSAVKFVNATGLDFKLASGSPAINKGKSISTYSISQDFYKKGRLSGGSYDIGSSEYQY
jgi:hypothetical protein